MHHGLNYFLINEYNWQQFLLSCRSLLNKSTLDRVYTNQEISKAGVLAVFCYRYSLLKSGDILCV